MTHTRFSSRLVFLVLGPVLFLVPGWLIAVELPSWERRWSSLEEQLALCTSLHGYDADTANQLGEDVIGAGELEWRECAYESLIQAMAKESPIEDAYQRLILEDRRLTNGIIAGEVTRTERQNQILTYLDEIHRAEKAEHDLRTLEYEREMFIIRMNELKRMRDIERLMR